MEMVARGNLREVYLDTELERYEANANSRAERQGPLDAVIMSGRTPHWYVLVAKPGEERSLAAHLMGRRFGVYLPMLSRTTFSRGKPRVISRLMFPGYIFVFGWGIHEQQRRIMTCPGAVRFLHTEAGTLLVVADGKIDEIQAIEANHDAEVMAAVQAVVNADEVGRKPAKQRSKRKKWRKKHKHKVPVAAAPAAPDEPMTITISTRSHWTGIETLSDEGRISLLHSALGLGSSVAISPVSPVAGTP